MMKPGKVKRVDVSFDGGRTWGRQPNTWPDDEAALGLAVSPAYGQDRTVYAAIPGGVRVSRDGGASWDGVPGPSVPP